jgi:alpha-methylacyl-CoA racemase
LSHTAGHDINYVALTGALHLIGERGRKPVPPLNLVGDFGGGAMMLLAGVLAALIEAGRTGRGQVVDAAMTDGTVALLGLIMSWRARDPDAFRDATGEEALAGGAPFYGTYETRDGGYLALGAIEPQFHALLIEKLGVDRKHLAAGFGSDRALWPAAEQAIAAAIRTRTRDEWAAVFEGIDACATPVLSLAEAARHPHNVARGTFITVGGVEQPAPAPRFSGHPQQPVRAPTSPGVDTIDVLRQAGLSEDRIALLRQRGAIC